MELNELYIVALTHKNIELKDIGKFHLEDEAAQEKLTNLKQELGFGELMYMSTCNRVEFIFTTKQAVDDEFFLNFFMTFNPLWRENDLLFAVSKAACYRGEAAVKHLFDVASSLDSLVIGEREIITQVRKAFDTCNGYGLTGDVTRILTRQTIKTAKRIYTHTSIARNPVSVVSLAYKKLAENNIDEDANFLIIGSGKTNATMVKFLQKHGCKNFTTYNRTIANAEKFSQELGGVARPLTELEDHKEPFDVILTCTSSANPIITKELYAKILNGDKAQKIVVDLAIPNDFDSRICDDFDVKLLSINELKEIAEANMKQRGKELYKCEAIIQDQLAEFKQIFKERKVEVAMKKVPEQVKEIKKNALEVVFHKDLSGLDEEAKKVLLDVMNYVEKKYVSMPMQMAKKIILETESKP